MPISVTTRRQIGLVVRTEGRQPLHKSGAIARDVDELPRLLASALETYQRRLGIAPERRLKIRSAYPKDPIENPGGDNRTVYFRVVRRQLGNMTNDGDRRPFRPQMKEVVDHPELEGKKLVTYLQRMDNEVEFEVTSPFSDAADEAAIFFERFMVAYLWYLKEMGIREIRYLERSGDGLKTIGGTELYCRPIRYHVGVDLISQNVLSEIGEILVDYDLGAALRTEVIDEENRIAEHSIAHPQGST